MAGNIHYGYVGKLAGFDDWELLSGASIAQFISTKGGRFDPPEDTEMIKVGIELAKGGDLCSILKKKNHC